MKRRKIIGLVLFTATIVYLVASFLALYQNQRVKMEKGIEEALKAYSQKENAEVKELSKDINLLLDEKVDISDLDEQRLIYEGSFARMEKNVTNVTGEITTIENSVANIINRITEMQNQLNDVTNSISAIENLQNEVMQNRESLIVMENEISDIKNKIVEIENTLKQKNVLLYQYDAQSQTLNIYGNGN